MTAEYDGLEKTIKQFLGAWQIISENSNDERYGENGSNNDCRVQYDFA